MEPLNVALDAKLIDCFYDLLPFRFAASYCATMSDYLIKTKIFHLQFLSRLKKYSYKLILHLIKILSIFNRKVVTPNFLIHISKVMVAKRYIILCLFT